MPRPRKILPKKRERQHPLAVGTGPARVFDFIRRNTHLTLLDWQRHVIEGIYREHLGKRVVRESYVSVARHNGKSVLAAAIGLYELFHERADVLVVASDIAQGRDIIFRALVQLVEDSKTLRPLAVVQRTTILVPSLRSRLTVIPADAPGAQGLHPSTILFDELHVQKTRDLFDALKLGLRPGGLLVATTTAGDNRESICYERYTYAKQVLRGEIEDASMHAYIAEAEDGDDWRDPQTWAKANPALELTLEEIRQDAQQAEALPAAQNAFLRYRCNRWVSQYSRWLDMATWDANGGAVDEAVLAGALCYGGLDLAAVSDLTALVLVFPEGAIKDGGIVRVVCRFWCAETMLTSPSNRMRDTYAAWQRQGFLRTTPGATVIESIVAEDIIALSRRFDIRSIGIDTAFEGRGMAQRLEVAGLRIEPLKMTMDTIGGATLLLERLVKEQRLRHGGHPILRWNADNIEVRVGPMGAMLPSKKASRDKIDGIVALIYALDQHEKHPPGAYDRHGVLVL